MKALILGIWMLLMGMGVVGAFASVKVNGNRERVSLVSVKGAVDVVEDVASIWDSS